MIHDLFDRSTAMASVTIDFPLSCEGELARCAIDPDFFVLLSPPAASMKILGQLVDSNGQRQHEAPAISGPGDNKPNPRMVIQFKNVADGIYTLQLVDSLQGALGTIPPNFKIQVKRGEIGRQVNCPRSNDSVNPGFRACGIGTPGSTTMTCIMFPPGNGTQGYEPIGQSPPDPQTGNWWADFPGNMTLESGYYFYYGDPGYQHGSSNVRVFSGTPTCQCARSGWFRRLIDRIFRRQKERSDKGL
jgi:hypothetical protein